MSELLLIFLVALLVFGAKRLPEIARGLGQGIREFRKATHEVASELQVGDVYRPPVQRPVTPPASIAHPPPPTPPAETPAP